MVRSTVVPRGDQPSIALPERHAAARVEAGRRLVEEEHRRPGDQRGGEVEAAAHAARVRADESAAGLGEVERREQLVRPLARRPAAEVVEAADHLEVLEAGQVLVHGRVLAGEPDALAHLAASRTTSKPATRAVPSSGREQRRQDPDGRRLAGAVRAEQAEDGPGRDEQVDAVERDDVAVALA